MSHRP